MPAFSAQPDRSVSDLRGSSARGRLQTDLWSRPRWQGVPRPTVSVIVTTYNRASFLEAAITSIFSQSVPVHEVLIVDDGSVDDTRSVVNDLIAAHLKWKGRLRYFWQENQGKSAALNLGLKFATGDWIAFNDSDDQWLPEKLELQFTALGIYEVAEICFADARFVNNPAMHETALDISLPDRTFPFGIKHDVASLYLATWPGIYMQTLLVSRRVMQAFGEFDPAIRMSMDVDFAYRLGLIAPMCYVSQPLVEIDRTEPRSIGLTTEFPFNGIDRLAVHERILTKWLSMAKASRPGLIRRVKARLSHAQSALANHFLMRRDFKAARVVLARAARQNPRPWVLGKLFWSMVAPSSLRAEVIRRARLRGE